MLQKGECISESDRSHLVTSSLSFLICKRTVIISTLRVVIRESAYHMPEAQRMLGKWQLLARSLHQYSLVVTACQTWMLDWPCCSICLQSEDDDNRTYLLRLSGGSNEVILAVLTKHSLWPDTVYS